MEWLNTTMQIAFFILIIGIGHLMEALTCFVCSSDKSDICATLQFSFKNGVTEKTCESFDDSCFIYIKGTEVTRGCKLEYLLENGLDDDFFSSVPNSKYEICDKTLCNSRDIEQTKCYACESESGSDLSCISGTLTEEMVKECPFAILPSNCYHFIDVNLGVTRRGCTSDLLNDNNLLDECKESGDSCKLCQGNLCNSMNTFQKCSTYGNGSMACNSNVTCSRKDNCNQEQIFEEYCIVCESNESIDCILNPKIKTMRTKCPLAMKTLGCFVASKGKSQVVRGCMSSLGPAGQKACNEENEILCKSCSGDSCNQQMHFFTCHSCDSRKDPSCVAKPDNVDIISCLNSKKCYTEISDGTVKRGCINEVKKCSEPICKACVDKMNCNNEPVHVEKCIKCDSKNDTEEWCHSLDSNAIGLPSEECNLEAVQQGCFHYINDDGLMKRGCVNKLENDSDLLKDCKSNSDKCKICHGENCNFKKTFPKCLNCNYLEETQCAIQPLNNKVTSKVCASYMDQCFTLIENKNVIRGCLGESEHHRCLDGDKMCAVCDPAKETNCNNQKLVLERCIECDSTIDGAECRSDPKKFRGRICSGIKESQSEGCFFSIVGDHYKRGCVSKLSPDEKNNCRSQSNTCKTSFGTDSNYAISYLECYECDSREQPECSRNLTINTKFCESLVATCTTGIDDHGVTHRRCSKANETKILKHHKICNKSKCNRDIFPENRLQCYQCNGDDACNLMPKEPNPNPDETSTPNRTLTTDPSTLASTLNPTLNPNQNGQLTKPELEKLPCNVHSVYDQCYTYMDMFRKMHRGCLSDSTDSRLLCESNDTFCIKCTKSGCNDQPILRKPSFKCIHCTDKLKCAYGQDDTNSKICEKQVLFNAKESCYARSLSNGTEFERGCIVDLMEKEPKFSCIAEKNCTWCDTPDCNTQNIIQRSCQRCSSLIDADCIYGNGVKKFTVLCDGKPYPYSKSGCYTHVKDHHVERGCVKDLKEKYDECMRETESCVLCDKDNCNIDDHSSGHRNTSTVFLTVFAIFFIFSYF